jgi:hypothetical protein
MPDDLVPQDQVAECEALLASTDPALMSLRAAFGPKSSLPPVAEIFYTSGGCWNLALAIHEKTELPIEVYFRGTQPTHAYVVDGEYALDARGRNPLRRVRLGAARTQTVTPAELFAMFESDLETGMSVARVVRRPDWVAAAARAAEIVVDSHGTD